LEEDETARLAIRKRLDNLHEVYNTTMDTRLYEAWQAYWGDSLEIDRKTKLEDYELLVRGKLGPIDPDDPVLIDPGKEFREHDMDSRPTLKRPKDMPTLELPLVDGFVQLEAATVDEVENLRFGTRASMGAHIIKEILNGKEMVKDIVKEIVACTPTLCHVHAYTDGSGMEIDMDDTLAERFGAGVYACRTTSENSQISSSYTWKDGR
jgi:hypothetical protein